MGYETLLAGDGSGGERSASVICMICVYSAFFSVFVSSILDMGVVLASLLAVGFLGGYASLFLREEVTGSSLFCWISNNF